MKGNLRSGGLAKATGVSPDTISMNLILNAIEAMKETGGALTVMSQLGESGQLLISVSDTGVGLPKEKTEQIFDAFFTTKPQDRGMGLSITRSIVESHGGLLWGHCEQRTGRDVSFHSACRGDSVIALGRLTR